ncbi:hypothetical protein KIW84_021538, partial [Lathyrus oleraceus]
LKMINLLFLFTCLVVCISGHQFDRMQSTLIEDMEIEKELKLINKVPIKSIHYAEVISYPRYDFYNGVSGTSSVYNVKIRKGQSSSAVMYIRNGPDSTSYIGMGWHIAPDLYNDDDTHFYVVWT